MALWSYLIDVQLMYVECFSTIWYPKKTFFADFFFFFHAFCQFVIIIMLCFGGDVWLKSCFLKFCVSHQFFCFSSQPLSWGGRIAFCQTTHLPLHVWFQGGIWTGYDCLSFIPLLPDGNQLITHSCRFLDMEQTKFNLASCAVGRNVHCCILMKAADFSLLQRQLTVFSIWKKT